MKTLLLITAMMMFTLNAFGEGTDQDSGNADKKQTEQTAEKASYDHYKLMEICGGVAYPEDITKNKKEECDQTKIFAAAAAKAKAENKPLVVVFGADWCGPCRKFAKTMKNASEEEKKRVNDKVVLAKINVNRGTTGDKVMKDLGLNIRAIPSGFTYMDANDLKKNKPFFPSMFIGNADGFAKFVEGLK